MAGTTNFGGERHRSASDSPSKLNQSLDFFRRKVDKIPTPSLRSAVNNVYGLHSDDVITGERFYLTVDEIKVEMARRLKVATDLAGQLYTAYANDANWQSINGDALPCWDEHPLVDANPKKVQVDLIRAHWIAVAECAIEKYRCLL